MSRVSFNCTMQEGQIGEELRAELAAALQQITQDVLGEVARRCPRDLLRHPLRLTDSAAASRQRPRSSEAASSAE